VPVADAIEDERDHFVDGCRPRRRRRSRPHGRGARGRHQQDRDERADEEGSSTSPHGKQRTSIGVDASAITVPDVTGTLYITGDSESDGLLNSDGTALLVGMLLDQQVPMEWAFAGPATLRRRLGHLDARRIATMDVDDFVAVCCAKPAIHRFPAALGRRIHQLCVVLADDYDGEGANLWGGAEDGQELYRRLRELPGYGDEKAKIFVAILGKTQGVTPQGWREAAGKFGDPVPRSVADVTGPDSLAAVRAWKQAQKAAKRDKQDRPLV
jgi:uncharacterized HhH-GPD family protein